MTQATEFVQQMKSVPGLLNIFVICWNIFKRAGLKYFSWQTDCVCSWEITLKMSCKYFTSSPALAPAAVAAAAVVAAGGLKSKSCSL